MKQLTVLPKHAVDNLIAAARRVQQLMDDSTIGNAFCGGTADQVQDAIEAFDNLNNAAATLADEQKIASPFLRYRREILARGTVGGALRQMVLSMYCGTFIPLRFCVEELGDHEARIALECLNSFITHGDRDSQFMSLAMEIAEAANEPAEVAA